MRGRDDILRRCSITCIGVCSVIIVLICVVFVRCLVLDMCVEFEFESEVDGLWNGVLCV